MYILALTSPDELSSSTSNTSIKCAYCRFLIIHISLTEGSIPLLMLNGTGAVINTKAHAHGCAKLRNDIYLHSGGRGTVLERLETNRREMDPGKNEIQDK